MKSKKEVTSLCKKKMKIAVNKYEDIIAKVKVKHKIIGELC